MRGTWDCNNIAGAVSGIGNQQVQVSTLVNDQMLVHFAVWILEFPNFLDSISEFSETEKW